MTYEQAGHGRAGLGINTDEGTVLTLIDRINHHYTTSISTIEIASQNIKKLNTAYQEFYKNKSTKYKNFILSGNVDNINKLKKLLDRHEIKYGSPSLNKVVKGFDFNSKKNKSIKFKPDNLIKENYKDVKVSVFLNKKLNYQIH